MLILKYFQDLIFLKKFPACDPNCVSCKTNGPGKCDPGNCNPRFLFNTSTTTCQGALNGNIFSRFILQIFSSKWWRDGFVGCPWKIESLVQNCTISWEFSWCGEAQTLLWHGYHERVMQWSLFLWHAAEGATKFGHDYLQLEDAISWNACLSFQSRYVQGNNAFCGAAFKDSLSLACLDGTEVSTSGLMIGRSPAQIPPNTNFSIMIKLPVKSTGE